MAHTHLLAPDQLGEVQELKPQSSGEVQLTPESIVLCVNRGREPLFDTFDSRHYRIEPGYFTIQLGAARHFKARAVVPGTRNPETRFEASFISIIGIAAPTPEGLKVVRPVDDPREWAPFTDEECREYGHAVEALDRVGMVDPIDPVVSIVPTRGQANEDAKAKGQSRLRGNAPAGRGATRIDGTGKDQLKPGNTEPNEAVRTIQTDLARQAAGKDPVD